MHRKHMHSNSTTMPPIIYPVLPHFRQLSIQETDNSSIHGTGRLGSDAGTQRTTPLSRKSASSITDLSGPSNGTSSGPVRGPSLANASSRTSTLTFSRKTSLAQSRSTNRSSNGGEGGSATQSSHIDLHNRKLSVFSRENTSNVTSSRGPPPSSRLNSSRKTSTMSYTTRAPARQRTFLQTGDRERTQAAFQSRAQPNHIEYRSQQPPPRQQEQKLLHNGRSGRNSRSSSFSSRHRRDYSDLDDDDQQTLSREKRLNIEAWLLRGEEEIKYLHNNGGANALKYDDEQEEPAASFLRSESLPSLPDSPSELHRDTAIHVVYGELDSR